jgi:hypothetical protein
MRSQTRSYRRYCEQQADRQDKQLMASPIQQQLERFVYADVATEPNGMELSVLSALSRRGLDPWQEAQRLAHLPPSTAADGLAQILRALPVQALDAKATSERLVALLPVQDTVTAPRPVPVTRGLTLAMIGAIFGGLLMALLIPKQAETVARTSWIAEVLSSIRN